jgi:hypothetical protein
MIIRMVKVGSEELSLIPSLFSLPLLAAAREDASR